MIGRRATSSAAAALLTAALLTAALLAGTPARAQSPPGASPPPAAAPAAQNKLKVCADPNNLPFSNRRGEGFENRLAQLWAHELGVEVEYTWFPQRRGFERHTLTAQDPVSGAYLCDVIMGVPEGYDRAMTTRPYYRSTYALVYVPGGALDVDSGEALIDLPPAVRESLRIGVFTPGPAAEWLARHGMYRQMVPYSTLQGDPNAYPGQIIENELLAGRLDAAVVWGPIGGYFAAHAAPRKLTVVPLRSEPGVRFDYAIAAGVRFGDRAERALLEGVMAHTTQQISALLTEYHVPLLESAPAAENAPAGENEPAAQHEPVAERGAPDENEQAAGNVLADETKPSGGVPSPPEERGELVYVTNEGAGTISIISTATQSLVGEVEVGTRPRGIEVNAAGDRVYVALSGSPRCPPSISDEECAQLRADKSKDGIGVVDARERKLIRVLPGGSDPEEFDVDAADSRLFVSNEDIGQLSIVDIETGDIIRAVDVGREPEGVRLSPDGKSVYVTSESDHAVTVVDAASGQVQASIPVGLRPRDTVFSEDGTRAYVSTEAGGGVAVVDVASRRVLSTIKLPPGSLPMGLALSPDGERLYVANGRAQTVSAIDLESGELVGQIRVGARPWGLDLTSDGKLLYTANGPSNDVSVIDTANLTVVATIPAGASPWGIAIGPAPAVEPTPEEGR